MNLGLRGNAVHDADMRHDEHEVRPRLTMGTQLYADTNLRILRYIPETVYGQIPTGSLTMQQMRTTGDTIAYNKTQVISREIRSDRQVPSVIETGVTVEGALNMELSLGGTWDNLLQAVCCGTWVNITLTALTLTFAPAVSGVATVARSAGSWITDLAACGAGGGVGLFLQFGGTGITAANKGPFKVSAVTALTLSIEDPNAVVVTESGLAAGTATGSILQNGTTKRSYFIEKQFSDITDTAWPGNYIQYLGMRPVEWAFNLKAQAVIDGTMTFWGHSGAATTTSAATTTTVPTTTPDISASADVATLMYQNASIVSPIKDLAITLTNTPRHRAIVGSLYDADIGFGQFSIRMTGTALVSDLSMFNDVVQHNTVSIDVPCFDGAGNYLFISFPATKLTGNPDTPAGNQDVDFRLTAEAFMDPATSAMIILNRVTLPSTLG